MSSVAYAGFANEGTCLCQWLCTGITGQGQQGSNQQNCNPLGLGLNLGALPMNPALVAAALNQAGWGLIGNLQNQQEPVGGTCSSVGVDGVCRSVSAVGGGGGLRYGAVNGTVNGMYVGTGEAPAAKAPLR